jgi:transposase-like protein
VDFDTYLTDEAVCPHCGYTHRDSWEFEGGHTYTCDECDEAFLVECNYDVSYITEKA